MRLTTALLACVALVGCNQSTTGSTPSTGPVETAAEGSADESAQPGASTPGEPEARAPSSHTVTCTDPSGEFVTEYDLDANGRLVRKFEHGLSPITWTYSERGELVQTVDHSSTRTYEYEEGRLVRQASGDSVESWQYEDGRRSSGTWTEGDEVTRTIRFEYEGNIEREIHDRTDGVSFGSYVREFDEGLLVSERVATGPAATRQSDTSTSYEYDSEGRIILSRHESRRGRSFHYVSTIVFARRADGAILTETKTDNLNVERTTYEWGPDGLERSEYDGVDVAGVAFTEICTYEPPCPPPCEAIIGPRDPLAIR